MFVKSPNKTKLDREIATQLDMLEKLRDSPEEYDIAVDRITRLEKLKSDEGLRPLSWDTVIVVGANIFGILWLARYEQENVIKSQTALRNVIKPRL